MLKKIFYMLCRCGLIYNAWITPNGAMALFMRLSNSVNTSIGQLSILFNKLTGLSIKHLNTTNKDGSHRIWLREISLVPRKNARRGLGCHVYAGNFISRNTQTKPILLSFDWLGYKQAHIRDNLIRIMTDTSKANMATPVQQQMLSKVIDINDAAVATTTVTSASNELVISNGNIEKMISDLGTTQDQLADAMSKIEAYEKRDNDEEAAKFEAAMNFVDESCKSIMVSAGVQNQTDILAELRKSCETNETKKQLTKLIDVLGPLISVNANDSSSSSSSSSPIQQTTLPKAVTASKIVFNPANSGRLNVIDTSKITNKRSLYDIGAHNFLNASALPDYMNKKPKTF